MDKSKLNFFLDAVMFLCLMGIAGIGFLMKYVLLPGKEAHAVYGSRVELSWLGWNRHEWSEVHLYLAFLLLGLLVLHIILHWDMIVRLFKKFFAREQYRPVIAFIFVLISALLLLFSFFIQPNVEERGPGAGRGRGRVEYHQQAGGQLAALSRPETYALEFQDAAVVSTCYETKVCE